MQYKNLINWLALLRTANIGPVKFKQYLAIDPLLEELPDIAKRSFEKNKYLIEQDLLWADQPKCSIILLSDHDYPDLLRKIRDAPPVLFVKGNRALLNSAQVAIVGSRKASYIGNKTAFNFAADLAKLGITVTSGLAVGIDAAGHRGALSVKGGCTVAVLGNGLQMIYPKQHHYLSEDIVFNNGAVISEFPIGVTPIAGNFPRRNRIISGLSLGVLVIEASNNSGSLITVQYALEQNREVFVVPGSIYDQNVRGCHKLIKQGAKLVENIQEIVEDLVLTIKQRPKKQCNSGDLKTIDCIQVNNNLDQLQKKILINIDYQLTSVDLIIYRTGLDPGLVMSELVNLELSGYITALPGGYAKLL